jgi:hypothetical protein
MPRPVTPSCMSEASTSYGAPGCRGARGAGWRGGARCASGRRREAPRLGISAAAGPSGPLPGVTWPHGPASPQGGHRPSPSAGEPAASGNPAEHRDQDVVDEEADVFVGELLAGLDEVLWRAAPTRGFRRAPRPSAGRTAGGQCASRRWSWWGWAGERCARGWRRRGQAWPTSAGRSPICRSLPGPPALVHLPSRALDAVTARQLRETSADLTGVTYSTLTMPDRATRAPGGHSCDMRPIGRDTERSRGRVGLLRPVHLGRPGRVSFS